MLSQLLTRQVGHCKRLLLRHAVDIDGGRSAGVHLARTYRDGIWIVDLDQDLDE